VAVGAQWVAVSGLPGLGRLLTARAFPVQRVLELLLCLVGQRALEHGAAVGVAESPASEDANPCWRLHPLMEEHAMGSTGAYDTSR
jgi:hypothetical protein